jgi:GT2 family glycosyltransferase
MLEIVAATRASESEFWTRTPLGISLNRLPQVIKWEPKIALGNTRGLPEVYNERIQGRSANDLLLFVHDDVWLDDFFLVQRIQEGLERYDVIGVAGNRRRRPKQPSWFFRNDKMERDVDKYLSGVIAHGPTPFGKLSAFGPVPADCELLDGVFLAARRSTLKRRDVLFDPTFSFHCYDLDFCRTARSKGLKLGTWPVAITHRSGGNFGAAWKEGVALYRQKWGVDG